LARNIELKARCRDLAAARQTCERLGARFAWTRRQTDVYFATEGRRLKLRIEEPGEAMLVSYHRADAAAARQSRYQLSPVGDPGAAEARLAARHGRLARVVKTRMLYRLGNVRIHLDTVEGLGTFVEFEAVLKPGDSEADARGLLAGLQAEFGLRDGDLVAVSYADLIGAGQ